MSERKKGGGLASNPYQAMMSSLPHPVVMVDQEGYVAAANDMAQFFFSPVPRICASRSSLNCCLSVVPFWHWSIRRETGWRR